MKLYLGPLVGGLLPSVIDFTDSAMAGDPVLGIIQVAEGWTGYNAVDKSFGYEKPMLYYGALIGGMIAHKLAVFLGVNRFLPKGINI